MIFEGYVCICFASKSCQRDTSGQWIIWKRFEQILFSHFKHMFRAQHAYDLWGIYVHLFHLKILPMSHLKPMNRMKGFERILLSHFDHVFRAQHAYDFLGYLSICFASKSCQWVTSSQWIVWRGFQQILFLHFKHEFHAQHANDLRGICVLLFHQKNIPMSHLKPMNHIWKVIWTNSIFALHQTRVSCTTR